ncbi:MAG: RNA polymerase sigma-70 factor [Bacteroidota bacterium]
MSRKDEVLFKQLFDNYYEALCNYANAFINDPMAAEDLVQNLFLQLWERKKFRRIEKIERFLIRSLKFKCIDYLRSKKKVSTLELDEKMPILQAKEDLTEEDILPLLHFYAALLPPKTREVFLLSRTKGMRYQDIATHLDISVKTVENQMGRALSILRKLLKDKELFLWILSYLNL